MICVVSTEAFEAVNQPLGTVSASAPEGAYGLGHWVICGFRPLLLSYCPLIVHRVVPVAVSTYTPPSLFRAITFGPGLSVAFSFASSGIGHRIEPDLSTRGGLVAVSEPSATLKSNEVVELSPIIGAVTAPPVLITPSPPVQPVNVVPVRAVKLTTWLPRLVATTKRPLVTGVSQVAVDATLMVAWGRDRALEPAAMVVEDLATHRNHWALVGVIPVAGAPALVA